MSDKATGRPWQTAADCGDSGDAAIYNERGAKLALVFTDRDASLIVHSVNNAEKLAEALRYAANELHITTDEKTSTSDCRDGALCFACAALAAWDK